MKQSTAVMMAMLSVVAAGAQAQGTRGKAEATIEGKKVAIDYGRPELKGRDMLARAPEGTVWRMGMNEATTITTEGDLVFGDVTIPKGAYSLFAKRTGEKSWTLVFNKQTGQWGTRHDASLDFASVPLAWKAKDDSTEAFTIQVVPAAKGGELKMSWGTHVLETPFKVK
jgi:hypothetical protein